MPKHVNGKGIDSTAAFSMINAKNGNDILKLGNFVSQFITL